MLGSELQERVCKEPLVRGFFRGVFAADEVKKTLREASPRSFCIVNTDKSSESGSHWYVVFKQSQKRYETFDSLGQAEETARHRVGKVKECLFNRLQVQANSSTSCGKFAAYFAVTRTLNYEETFDEVLSDCFAADLDKNEAIVNRFWTSDKLYSHSEEPS